MKTVKLSEQYPIVVEENKELRAEVERLNGQLDLAAMDNAKQAMEIERLREALEILRPIPERLLVGKPVRNLDEILLEVGKALKGTDQ